MMKNKFFYIFYFCFMTFNAFAAQINLSVDKTAVTEGETLFLSISYDGDDSAALDLGSLQNDFKIVSNSSSQQFSFVNGDMSRIKKWILGIQPLKTGKITINPIKIGKIISNSLTINVSEATDVAYAPDRQTNSNSPFFKINQSIDNENPYVQQQTLLLVRVYDSVGIQDANLSVDEETKKDWILIPLLSQPIIQQETVDYRHMNVLTYAYAAFPQRSGTITAPRITFDGFYVKNSDFGFPNFNDDFAMFGVNFRNIFGQNVPVKLKTEAKTVSVKPIPAEFLGKAWLPLNDLEVSATWSVKQGFKVGEAVSRTITVEATGISENMLPQITFPSADGINQYPEKPEIEEKIVEGKVVTTAQFNIVYIPVKSGNFTIPEIRIDWFNVEDNALKTAVIPEEKILVMPNAEVKESFDNMPKTNLSDAVPDENKPITQNNIEEKQASLKNFDIRILYPFLTGLLFLVFSVILFSSRKKRHKYRDNFIKELKKHDYKQAKEALLIWANAKFYPANIKNFNDIIQIVPDDDFKSLLSAFNRFLYSDSEEYFDTAKFIEIFKKIDKMKKKNIKNNDVLPNLYD